MPARLAIRQAGILFGEQFNYVSSSSGYDQVGNNDEFKIHQLNDITMSKSGYLYVFVSNGCEGNPVYFDNLQITHTRGPILEETHYYPGGLIMNGISSRAAGGAENKKKFNGYEQNTDFDINLYESFYRSHDPQISRFWQIDPKAFASISPYAAMENNPIRYMDPLGDIVVVANEDDRKVMLGYLRKALGGDYFNFNDKNELQFSGNIKNFKGDKKDIINGLLDVIGADYTAEIKMSGFTEEEAKTLDEQAKPNTLGEKGGGVSLITIDNKTNKILGAKILIRESDLQPVPLYDEVYYYKDENSVLQRSDIKPSGVPSTTAHQVRMKDGEPQTVPNTAANVLFHEIGHLLYENKSQKDVLKYENKARKLLGMPQRSPSDPAHQ